MKQMRKMKGIAPVPRDPPAHLAMPFIQVICFLSVEPLAVRPIQGVAGTASPSQRRTSASTSRGSTGFAR
jgi:hypothetical protein